MDEERNDILVTPERTMLEDGNLRNSTGKTSTSSSREKMLPPHYLTAPTGSCHDFCKYGRTHSIEAKGRHRIRRRVTIIVTKSEYSVNGATVSERKKKPAAKLRPSIDSETQFPNDSEIIKLEVPSSGGKKEGSLKQALSPARQIEVSPSQASPTAKKIDVFPKQAVSPAKKIKVSPKQVVSPAKKIKVSPKQVVSPAQKIKVSPKQAVSPSKKIEVPPKQAVSPAKKIEISPKRAVSAAAKKIEISPKQAASSAKKIEVSPKQVVSPAKKIEASPKHAMPPAGKRELSPKQALSPTRKFEVSPKQTSSPAKRNNASTKPGSRSKPKSIAAKPCPPLGLSGGTGGKRNSDPKILKKVATSKIDEKKTLRPPIASVSRKPSVRRDLSLNTRKYKIEEKKSLRPPVAYVSPKPSVSRVLSLNMKKYRSVKAVSSLKNQNKVKKAEPKLAIPVKEKTLYVIEQTENKSLERAQNGTHTTQSSPSPSSSVSASSLDSSSSKSSPLLYSHVEEEIEEFDSMLSEADYSISESEEIESEDQVETLNMKGKKSGRGAVHPENADCPPQKLHFRRGRVIILKSESIGPRRLRFRQGRVLGENDGRKSFRRRRGVTEGGSTDGTKPESEKVVLRHQDVQEKKDEGLFNNVIEETASKLVKTRKSKVKALVGAFETVIHLQETKS
ncbi:hypothetical protein NE237_006309 [Protea cynaroides]|uniref:Calmodulin-binding domain-containing protein n=1 Tax=Protea cynaroides TaxID=273540 RepID=A0A9Q0QV20_9MAGN|nr:hypothetical protein NE237_006309 [Protea cynaroides]